MLKVVSGTARMDRLINRSGSERRDVVEKSTATKTFNIVVDAINSIKQLLFLCQHVSVKLPTSEQYGSSRQHKEKVYE